MLAWGEDDGPPLLSPLLLPYLASVPAQVPTIVAITDVDVAIELDVNEQVTPVPSDVEHGALSSGVVRVHLLGIEGEGCGPLWFVEPDLLTYTKLPNFIHNNNPSR